MIELKIAKSPSEDLSVTNRVYFNQADWNSEIDKYVSISCSSKGNFKFRAANDKRVERGTICLGGTPRKWLFVSIGEVVKCTLDTFDSNYVVSEVLIEVELNNKKTTIKDPVDSDKLAVQFLERFLDTPISVEQQLLFNAENINFLAVIKQVKVVDVKNATVCAAVKSGLLRSNTLLKFDRRPEAKFVLTGRSKGDSGNINIISPDWDFNSIGVGGLDDEFSRIFRRAFMSRLMPPDYVDQLGVKHVRGILLYGPPGTGKTLMARQIGKMLNAREPKIVNGPSILDKYVGESEANIRKLFADAEKEHEKMGNGSALHIIIFDEIDAICKARGSLASSTAVHDTVVNQLLSKMDGVEQLNNILVIGMTNRKDLIDEALLRPGRMEVQVEIPLPTEAGRRQIFDIHCKRLKDSGVLAEDVDLADLAARTKNFSGAEIEGLVRAALSNAQSEKFDPKKGMTLRREEFDSFRVCRSHFLYALQNDIKPFFGQQDNEVQLYQDCPIACWGEPIEDLLRDAGLLISSVTEGQAVSKVTLLLHGPSHSGKTSLAASLAFKTGFTFVRMCSIRTMIGFSESGRCLAIKKIFDDAAKAPSSVIILDDLENLTDYMTVGPRFSVTLVKNLIGMITTPVPPGKKMLIIGTTEHLHAMRELGLLNAFGRKALKVPMIERPEEVVSFLEEQSLFSEKDLVQVAHSLRMDAATNLRIGVKQLLLDCNVLQAVEPEARVDKLLTLLKASGDEED